jgi:predicted nuclease of predicted toxin-antitoxin system
MKLLIDMNLSPRWVPWLAERGHTARHWLDYGSPTSTDAEIMAAARAGGEVVVTNDLDFGTLLALSGDDGPSVIQVRAQVLAPEVIGGHLVECLARFEHTLLSGALVSIDETSSKVRVLPIATRPASDV